MTWFSPPFEIGLMGMNGDYLVLSWCFAWTWVLDVDWLWFLLVSYQFCAKNCTLMKLAFAFWRGCDSSFGRKQKVWIPLGNYLISWSRSNKGGKPLMGLICNACLMQRVMDYMLIGFCYKVHIVKIEFGFVLDFVAWEILAMGEQLRNRSLHILVVLVRSYCNCKTSLL